MAFSNDVLREALKRVSERHKANIREFERQKSNVYEKTPELHDIDIDLQVKSSKMALLVFSGMTREAEQLNREITELNVRKRMLLKNSNLSDEPRIECKLCNDTGYYNKEICKCVKDIAAEICYSSLIDQMPLHSSTFENFDLSYYSEQKNENGISPKKQMEAVFKTCKRFADEFPFGSNLLLTGNSGLGKTHLSLAIANEVIKKGYHVIYGSAQNLINEVSRETFDRQGSTEKLDSLNSCDLLILDDLGTEFSTQLSVSVVYNIINTRLMKGLSTIISTNLDIKQISQTYNDRIASRIIGEYYICSFFGNDIRQIRSVNRR